MSSMDIHEILHYLPHRYPFLLVDRVLELELDPVKRIKTLKNVTINEPFFPGHFPGYPVMPGVLIIEAMAQSAAILAFKSAGKTPEDGSIYFFAGIDAARFKRPIIAGDQMIMSVEMIAAKRGLYKFTGRAEVDGTIACEAEMMCAERKV